MASSAPAAPAEDHSGVVGRKSKIVRRLLSDQDIHTLARAHGITRMSSKAKRVIASYISAVAENQARSLTHILSAIPVHRVQTTVRMKTKDGSRTVSKLMLRPSRVSLRHVIHANLLATGGHSSSDKFSRDVSIAMRDAVFRFHMLSKHESQKRKKRPSKSAPETQPPNDEDNEDTGAI